MRWTRPKYRKHYGDDLEQQDVVQIKQVIHEHRAAPARPDVERGCESIRAEVESAFLLRKTKSVKEKLFI